MLSIQAVAAKVRDWFRWSIDPNYPDGFDAWYTAALWDQFTLDGVAVHPQPTRVPGKGPLGSSVAAWELLDASTIRPLVDIAGALPAAPAPAYQQYIWGVPRVDLIQVLATDDLGEAEKIMEAAGLSADLDDLDPDGQYRADELHYWRQTPWTNSPYGFSPVMAALLPIAIGLQRQVWLADYYSEGCHDETTEVLTDQGWRRFRALGGTERLATRSAKGEFQWQAPKAIYRYQSKGEMLRFTGQAVDLQVTAGHRMLVSVGKRRHAGGPSKRWQWSPYDFVHAAQLQDGQTRAAMPLLSNWRGTPVVEKIIPAITVNRRHRAVERAAEIIRTLVPCPAKVALEAVMATGVSDRAAYMAKVALGVQSYHEGSRVGGAWHWGVPTAELSEPDGHMPSRGWKIPMRAWAEFVGLYLAEGWVREPYEVFVSQSPKSARLSEVRRILDATPFRWHYSPEHMAFSTTSKTLVRELQEYGTSARTKWIPVDLMDLPVADLEAFLNGFWVGDGWHTPEKRRGFGTMSPALADGLQELLLKTGRAANCHVRLNGLHTLVELSLREGRRVLPKPERVPYEGDVWCAEVPNGTLYTRRNGVVALTGNSIPGVFLEAGPQYNTSTLQKQLQDTLNSYAGDIALKHRIIVLPPGSKPRPQKDLSFGKDVDLAIMEYFYPVLQIQPQEIGQMPGGRTSGLGGRGATEQMAESISNQRTKPDRNRWKGRFDRQIQSRAGFAQPDLEWKWIVDQDQDDPDKRAAAEASDVSHGIRTIDDIVTENGGDPWGLPLTSTPIFVMPTGIIPLDPSVQAPAPIAPGGSVPGAPAGESDTEPNAPSGAPAEAAPEAARTGQGAAEARK